MIFSFFCFIAVGHAASPMATELAAKYPSSAWMNGPETFRLWWKYIPQNVGQNIPQNLIEFAIEAQTTGWVAMGISTNNQMPDSDIVVAWVDGTSGDIHAEDRNSFAGRVTPAKDAQQNVQVMNGSEVGGWTIVSFRRPLTACEPNDLPIPVGSTRVLFAFSPSNTDGPSIDYHGTGTIQKGSKTINLEAGGRSIPSRPAGSQTFSASMTNAQVPVITTSYICQLIPVPTFQSKVHVIEILPVVQPSTASVVHHMVLYACQAQHNPVLNTGDQSPHGCGAHNMAAARDCRSGQIVTAWAVGGAGIIFPADVGYPLGPNHPIQYLMLEMHYDNPSLVSGLVDTSGLQFVYTTQLRQYDAGAIWLGTDVSAKAQFIPPNYPGMALNTAFAPASCVNAVMDAANVTSVNVIFSMLHMHTLGRSITLRHLRNGVELKPIDSNPGYDFDFQQQVPIYNTVFQRGDEMILDCWYNSTGKSGMTYGGAATLDEMCMVFLTVYPAIPLSWLKVREPGAYSSMVTTAASNNLLTVDGSQVVTSLNVNDPAAIDFYKSLYDNRTSRGIACDNGNGTDYLPRWGDVQFPTIVQPYNPTGNPACFTGLSTIAGPGTNPQPGSPTAAPTARNTTSLPTVAPSGVTSLTATFALALAFVGGFVM